MKHLPLLILFAILISGCGQLTKQAATEQKAEVQSTDLSLDHFNIWVENPDLAKSKLMEIGFRFFPDSLNTPHQGQGTAGKYCNFLNSYLELIYVNDPDELIENNRINDSLDFVLRADYKSNEALPFGIALRQKDYNKTSIPFKTVTYHQEWMENNGSIYSAVTSRINLAEPSVFVVYSDIYAQQFENLDSVMNISAEYDFFRQSFVHPNGAQKLSKVVITSKSLDLSSETMRALGLIDRVEVKNGPEQLMELYFDNEKQGKSFDLRPDLPLKIYL